MVIVDGKETAMKSFSTRGSSEFDAELPTYGEANLDREEEDNKHAANKMRQLNLQPNVAVAPAVPTIPAVRAGPSVPSPDPITPAVNTRSVRFQPPAGPPPAAAVVASPIPTVPISPPFPSSGASAPPSFLRPPPAQYSYKPFPVLCLPGRRGEGPRQAVEFPQEPPVSHLSPHPFSEHDVTEDDWVRFLSDLQSTVNAPSPKAPPPRVFEGLPMARSFGLSGMDYLLRSLNYVTDSVYNLGQMVNSLIKGPAPSRLYEHVVQLVDGWNNYFFRPRRMEAVLLRGGARVGGSGNVPPALEHELAHVMRVHREREQRHSRRNSSSSSSSDSSDSVSDSESEDDLYEPYPPTNAAVLPTAAGPVTAPTAAVRGAPAVAANAVAAQDPRTLKSLAKAVQKAEKKARKANKRAEKDRRKAAKKTEKDVKRAEKDVKRAEKKAIKRERKAEKRERRRGIPKDRSAQGPSRSEPVDDGVWRVFLLPAGSY